MEQPTVTTKKKPLIKKRPIKVCQTCQGYGLWAIGDPSPMGHMDAADGVPTIPCPECWSNKNPSS